MPAIEKLSVDGTSEEALIMSRKKRMKERRAYQRFRTQEGTYAVFGPHSSRIGQIMDISMGGIAFHYMAGQEPNGRDDMSIFLAESSFYLKKISFETIWDKETRRVPFSSINMRRRGIAFADLSDDQRSQLEHFIENHTLDRG